MPKKKIKKHHLIIGYLVVVAILVIGGVFFAQKIADVPSNISVKRGQEYTLNLNSNASTGYSWSVNDTYDKNVVVVVSHGYKGTNTTKLGASGKELWKIKGTGRGTTKLEFTYARQWEKPAGELDHKTFTITVK